MDRLAVAQGDKIGEETIAKLTKEYWKKYVSGVVTRQIETGAYWRKYVASTDESENRHKHYIATLRKHLAAACEWRDATNYPMTELCAWWRKEDKR